MLHFKRREIFSIGLAAAFLWAPARAQDGGAPLEVATPSSAAAIDAGPPPAPVPAPPAESPKIVRAEPELPPPPSAQRPDSESATLALKAPPWDLRALAPLAAVLGVILFLAVTVRWFRSRTPHRGGGPLRIVHRCPLGPKHSVALARVGRRYVLLGVTPERITTLTEIADPEECARINAGADGAEGQFERLLEDESVAYERGPIEPPLGRTDGSKRMQEARGSIRALLDRLNASGSRTESRVETPV